MGRRETTKADSQGAGELTPQQEAAVDLLAIGKTVTEVAESVGVARQTVSEWLNRHHGFRAALNARRQELWGRLTDRMRALLPKALDVLDRALDSDAKAAQAAAVQLIKACGLYGLEQPAGHTSAQDLEIVEKEQEWDRSSRLITLSL